MGGVSTICQRPQRQHAASLPPYISDSIRSSYHSQPALAGATRNGTDARARQPLANSQNETPPSSSRSLLHLQTLCQLLHITDIGRPTLLRIVGLFSR